MLEILIEKIISLAIIMAAGFCLTKFGPLTLEDSRSLSRLTVHLIMPCSILNAFQREQTPEVLKGLILVLLAAVCMHGIMILLTRLLRKPLKLSPVEQASVVYTNAGNLMIPLVSAMLGKEWVIYTCAYILMQTVLTWSHGKFLVCQEKGVDWKALLKNHNIWALAAGASCFLLNFRLPGLLGTTVSSVASMVGPSAMLVIGMTMGTLSLRKALGNSRIWLVTLLRLLVFPLFCLGGLKLLCLVFPTGAPFFMVTMMAASGPSAAVITHICQLYRRDPGAASSICAVTTALCTVTIPLMIQLYILVCM